MFFSIHSLERKTCDACDDTCNESNKHCTEVGACVATAVAALGSKCVNQQEYPTDYGNGIQNATPEIVPRREGSVRLGKKHVGRFGINFHFVFS